MIAAIAFLWADVRTSVLAAFRFLNWPIAPLITKNVSNFRRDYNYARTAAWPGGCAQPRGAGYGLHCPVPELPCR